MNKTMLLALSFLFAFIFQSCHKINGNGPTTKRSYSLKGFSGIDASIDADVYYTQDSFYSVEVEAQSNILDVMRVEVVGNVLSLGFEKYKNVWRHDRITVHVTSPDVNSFRINGSGAVRVLKPVVATQVSLDVVGSGSVSMAALTCKSLSVDISGSGDISINGGTAETESTRISGSGKVDLGGIKARTANIRTSGSGKTTVWVTDYLDVNISGSGDVYYNGNPSMRTEISGSGKVSHL